MSSTPADRQPDRREFLITAGAIAGGAVLFPHLDGLAQTLRPAAAASAGMPASWVVRPFALTQVTLGSGIFQQKRDRMLHYARTYGGDQGNMWNTYIAGEYGGMNESLAQLAALRPGKAEYLAAARRFTNTAVYRSVAANDDVLDGRHANQHIPQFIGYLRMFEGGGEREFHTAAPHFWDMVVPHRMYSHGGIGVGGMLRARRRRASGGGSQVDGRRAFGLADAFRLCEKSRFRGTRMRVCSAASATPIPKPRGCTSTCCGAPPRSGGSGWRSR